MVPNLLSRREVRAFFQKYRLYPSKKLGQNFLIDQSVIKKFLKAADLNPKDIVLEIGPGLGTLTQELAKRVKKVIAVEKDPKMIEILKETLKDFKNLEIIQGNILGIKNLKLKTELPFMEAKVKMRAMRINPHLPPSLIARRTSFSSPIKNYKVAANLPYYIVSPVIRKFLESKTPPKEMILMAQKEVAQRICANPPNMNLLAVSVQFYAKPQIIDYVSKKSFWPQPKVDSAIIKITPHFGKKSTIAGISPDEFFRIVKAGFSQPRKQIANNLSKMLKLDKDKVKSWLLKNAIQPSQRAETLTIEDWKKLTSSFKELF